ncbi:MAG TPA: exodeoxyribonuclease VII large subunit [Spirochaetia bacterium]|nr:exodeoxyribonuclease VII large subunit [Spirochaetia bacterium]
MKFTVSQITDLIKQTLEANFYDVTIEGEISNFRPSSTGHFYFTLKDEQAVISAVMFRNRSFSLGFTPADGQKVSAHGNLSVYGKRGTYQIIVERMEKSGEGDILALLEERKRRLAAEGLFDAGRKRPLPLLPTRVAVVTSPTGAALRDILNVTARRNAGINIVILPCPVQGEEAASKIARQIERANEYSLGDVIIVGRGGGSLEDLLPFSEESVVRAIAASRIPVISAVGHEIDTSLSDLAADLRAPTPSAAAEIVSASREELLSRIRDLRDSINREVQRRTERIRLLLREFTPSQLERNFRVLIQPTLLRLDDAKEMLLRSLQDRLVDAGHRVALAVQHLNSSSPLEVLKRGYSVVTDRESGSLLTSAGETEIGRGVKIRLHRGSIAATVEETTL